MSMNIFSLQSQEITQMAEQTKQYDDTNTGAIFKNTQRQKDTHPNARGRVNVEGKWFWLAAWTKTSGAGEKFQSIALTAMTQEEVDKYITKSTPQQTPAKQQEPEEEDGLI